MNVNAGLNPDAAADAPDRPLNVLASAWWIGAFSFREMIRRKRIVSVGLLMLLPVILAVAWRTLDRDGVISADLILANLSGMVYVHAMVALVSLAFGLSAIGETADEGTIIYYWTRPLSRTAIYLGRLWAAQTVSALLVAGSLVLCFLVMTVGNFGILNLDFLRLYVSACLVILLGGFVYTAIFAAAGTVLRRPMLPAILYAFGWEAISGNAPLKLQELTVVFHLRNLMHNPARSVDSMPNLLQELRQMVMREVPPEPWQSLLTLLGVIVVSTLLGTWLLRRKEIFR
ncbi:ABC transporter permease [bacterium]|nr:ABC transporter permease [bacterium]HPF35818.1 ABC transporter permease subunit [Candidatus Krumholzibacteria bacterium]HRX51571.1 ABC transporter permease subunit [Candidatus Krumholzibacteria bacterium]